MLTILMLTSVKVNATKTVAIYPRDEYKTAFLSKYSLFEILVLLFGLIYALSIF